VPARRRRKTPQTFDSSQRRAPQQGASITTYQRCREPLMFDAIMIAIALGFFALSVGYTIACDRL
jgi:hypothetical protein